MNKKAEQLQDALEQLESGKALETSREVLPTEEYPTLSLVARLRAAAWPEQNPQIVQAQRQKILGQYQDESQRSVQKEPFFNLFKDWRLPAVISVAVVALLVCGFVTILGFGGAIWFGTQQISDSSQPSNDIVRQTEGLEELSTAPDLLESLLPHEALLTDFQGQVEIQVAEKWQIVSDITKLTSKAHLRTSSFSSATLTFKDGSVAQIGPDSEISIEVLAVDPDNASREISLMQWSGESSHQVVPLNSTINIYQVDTPSALAQVKGTQFHLRVSSERTDWYVDAGAVEVNGGGATVQVDAGEMTSVTLDEAPTDPVDFIAGQGEVASIGESWIIGDQTYQTHPQTIIIGNPQVGDLVFYEGHLLEDESRVADLIVLVRRNPANTFTLTGEVQEMGDPIWIVNGQSVAVTELTDVAAGITIGDLVYVKGVILGDGILQAEEVRLVADEAGRPFEFTGVVQQIGDQSWLISDITVVLDENTSLDAGLQVGDAVQVNGWIMGDGTWLASSITYFLNQNSTFEFFGNLESMDPWVVAGISFEVRDWTAIDADLNLGDLVRVVGEIQTDGTWLAAEVQHYDDALMTILIGRVNSIDPWVVSGLELNVDAETVIEGEISVGTLVRVELQLLSDGTQKVIRIAPLEGFEWELGCQSLVVTVINIDGDQIILEGGLALTLGEDIQIEGEIQVGSLIQTMICYDEEMNVAVVYIIVLDEPILPPVDGEEGEKVTVCHKPNSKNPHTIVIAAPAVPAHLAHGDILGPCP